MTFINSFLNLIYEMAPFLLFGFLIAGILHVFVPASIYHKYLSQNNFRSVFWAALFGVPLPLCSCGVIPTATSLRREGASRGAVTSFLIATPQTGVDSILATYGLLGLPFALIRPIAAFVTGIFGGIAVNKFVKDTNETGEEIADSCTCEVPGGKKRSRIVEVFRYGFVNMFQDVGKWLVIGLVVAGIISIAVPDSFFAQYMNNPLLNMLIILIVAIPMYVCATGSIPIAASLMMKGITPGAALVFLMAGPAANFASILVVGKVLGKKTLWIYLLTITLGAIVFGGIMDYLLPRQWFSGMQAADLCCRTSDQPLWKIICGIIFIGLLANAFILKYIHRKKVIMDGKTIYRIGGMSCNHCKMLVENNLKKISGITSVVVDLADGTAIVTGSAEEAEIQKMVEDLGYEFKGKKQ